MAQTETDTKTTGTEDTLIIDSEESVDSAIDQMYPTETVEAAEEDKQEEVIEEVEAPEAEPEPEVEVEANEDVEPEPEKAEAEAEVEVEEETTSGKLTPQAQKILEDHIHKVEGKLRSENKEALSDLRKELQTEKDKLQAPTSAIDKVRQSWSNDDLDQIDDDAQEVIDFANDHPEGYTLNEGQEKERFISGEELKARRDNARETQKAIRPRRKLIAESEQHNAEIEAVYPDLKDPESEKSLQVKKVLNAIPSLKNEPDGKTLAVAISLGMDQLRAKPEDKPKAQLKANPKKVPEAVKAPSLGNTEQRSSVSGKTDTAPQSLIDALDGTEETEDAVYAKMFPT